MSIQLSYNGELYSYDNKTSATLPQDGSIDIVMHPYVDITGASLYYKQDDTEGFVTIENNQATIPGLYLVTGTLSVALKLPSGMSNFIDLTITTIPATENLEDDDVQFTMDNKKRLILVPGSQGLLAVQYDNKSELVTFKFPRYQDGIDLSDKFVYVNYKRPVRNDLGKTLCMIYKVEEDSVWIHWEVGATETQYDGEIQFQVEFADTEGYRWQTQIAKLPVVASLYNTGLEPYEPSVLEQYLQQMESILTSVQSTGQSMIQQIEAKGRQVIDSIPEDYLELQDTVFDTYMGSTKQGSVVSFADGANNIPVKSLAIKVEPKQDETPSADNIVPIEGYTSFSCVRAGKNFANPAYLYDISGASHRYDSDKGTLTVSGSQQYAASYFSIKAKKGVRYIFSAYAEDFEGEDSNARLGIRRGTATQLVASTTSITTPGWLLIGYTAVANEFLRFTLFTGYAHSGSKKTTYSHIQIEIATSRTPYERFEENQIFEPSLVDALYGGTLDLTNGVLTKTWENIASYAGESLPGRWLSDRDVYTEGGTPTVGAQVVYELESPVVTDGLTTYEVKTLYGYNNILCRDADNASIEVEYREDPTLYIDKRLSAVKAIIAGVESDYTATKNYAIDDFIIVGDDLYRVTAAIADDETIVPGTNCTETTVAEQLKALYTLVNS